MNQTMIARGERTVNSYLHVRDAAQLIQFYKQVFRAAVGHRGERPDGSVEHAELTIGDSLVELSDTPEGQPAMLHHYVPDADSVYRRAIAAGAVSLEEPVDQDYGDREAGIKDPAGNYWWIATHKGTSPIPEGLASVTVCLNPNGAAKLMGFLNETFLAEEMFKAQTPDGTVQHAKIKIGNSILEISDAHEPWPSMPCVVRVFLEDVDGTYRRALGAGAVSIAAPETKPYGEYNAGVKDAFGNIWYIGRVIT